MTQTEITRGTGNDFADFGLADGGERQTKARLALALNRVIKDPGAQTGRCGAPARRPQPKVSALVKYRLDGFSVEKLIEFIVVLGRAVEITVRPRRGEGAARISVREAA